MFENGIIVMQKKERNQFKFWFCLYRYERGGSGARIFVNLVI